MELKKRVQLELSKGGLAEVVTRVVSSQKSDPS